MEYAEKTLMRDDYLKIVKFIASDVFQPKIMRIFVWFNLVIHTSAALLTIHAVLFKIEMKEFVYYAPVLFASFYGILSLLTILFKGKMANDIRNVLKPWSIDCAGEEIHSRLKFEIKVITSFALFNFGVAIFAGCWYCIPLFADSELFYLLRFADEHFPNQKIIVEVIYRLSFLFLIYIMIVLAYQVIYYTQHARFQIMLFTEYLVNIAKNNSGLTDEELFYSSHYQEKLGHNLIFCVKRFQEFTATLANKLKEMGNLIVLFALFGCLLGIGVVFYILSDKFYPEYYVRMAASSVTAVATFVALILSGQSIENQADDVLNAMMDITWYNFDSKNKKSYLMFFTNVAAKSWKIKFSENYSINYQLGLAIVRSMYSILSVVVNMHKTE